MTLPRSVAEVVADHVVFEVECFDRLYLNVYQPRPQYPLGLVGYVKHRLGPPIASTAPVAKNTEAFSKAVRAFAAANQVPWVDSNNGYRRAPGANAPAGQAGSAALTPLTETPGRPVASIVASGVDLGIDCRRRTPKTHRMSHPVPTLRHLPW
jgi:hypothetical protein